MSSTRASLRAVTSANAPGKTVAPKSIADAAKSGTQRELLVAMRDRIATTADRSDCPPRELAALTKRIADIVKEIDALDARDDKGDGDRMRVRDLEAALLALAPNHPLLSDVVSDSYDPSSL